MFAVYADHAAPDDPLSSLRIGEMPDPKPPADWVRVKISHASLNRHDLFTLMGITGHPEGLCFPLILGNDAAGTLDGTALLGSLRWERPHPQDRSTRLRVGSLSTQRRARL